MRQSVSETETIRAIVMEDGAVRTVSICTWLNDDPDVEVVGVYVGIEEVLRAVPILKPDLLLIDAESSGEGAFESVGRLPEEQRPVTIFVGADEHLALLAFRVHAFDFLLKPMEITRFQTSLERAKQQLFERRLATINGRLLAQMAGFPAEHNHVDRILLRTGNRITFLKASEIDWIEAQGDYVRLYSAGKKHLLREKIGDLEHQLPPGFFMRIHRSVIVNIDRIKEMQPLLYGECTVILIDGTRLTLSRSYRDKVFTRFSKAS